MSNRQSTIDAVAVLGIGGAAASYIAKYFLFSGFEVVGYDLKKSSATAELQSLGAKVIYENPKELNAYTKIIYSDALPKSVIEPLVSAHPNCEFVEVGSFTRGLISEFESKKLSPSKNKAFLKANIAPLFSLDIGDIKLIGVTGTDGKTSTIATLHHMLSELGHKVGSISTVRAKIRDKELKTGLHVTTPSQHKLFDLLSKMKNEKCEYILIEATSHGLYMGRLDGLKFDVAVLTNIASDHLSYHKDWQSYAKAKSLLFTKYLKENGTAVINNDDKKSVKYLSNKIKANKIKYSLNSVDSVNERPNGISFVYRERPYSLPLVGKYNISNSLAAAYALSALDLDAQAALKTLKTYKTPTGRMEILKDKPFRVIVDFAHTENGLKTLLKSIKSVAKGRIILVFGCASQRDDSKRGAMGKWAKKHADVTILTAEDCRTESLKSINDEIQKGWDSYKTLSTRQLYRFDEDKINVKVRKDAIKKALNTAKPGDIVLITGKGHEESLCFGHKEYPWSDIKETKALLKGKYGQAK